MWILDSDADFLQGKRMWLKPGKKYLFGRVKRDGVRFAIDHKTISRKHFVITVEQVKPGDVSKIHTRTKVFITDQKSKQGTYVDGDLLRDDTRELTGKEHGIRPGAFQHEMLIRWVPCVLTFSLQKKEIKADALKPKRERLEELDIKVITEFVSGSTTHVVASKRNTAKGLQALIQGKHLVSDSYVDALVYAATSADLGEEENLSPMEQDFETSWPKEKNHLPKVGKEPTIKPAESYAPDPNRGHVFDNFVFVFGDQAQYENLLPPITGGHGKALLLKVNNGEMSIDEVVQFMRNAAGEKGFGDPDRETDSGGVIMVRWTCPNEQFSEWTQNLINGVALKLDQRAIDQAEFLDAILANDAFQLRQTIPYESAVDGRAAPPPSAASFPAIQKTPASPLNKDSTSKAQPTVGLPSSLQVPSSDINSRPPSSVVPIPRQNTQTIPSSAPEASLQVVDSGLSGTQNDNEEIAPPARRSRLRAAPIKRPVEFDDGFNAAAIPSYTKNDYPDSPSLINSESQSQPFDQANRSVPFIKDDPSRSRKRRRSPSPEEDGVDGQNDTDELLPAATAMKRQKLALQADARRKGQPMKSSSGAVEAGPLAIKARPKRKEKEIDVRETVKAQREAEEEAARRDEEDLAQGLGEELDGGDKGPANLAVILDLELPIREERSTRATSGHGERWDPKWNGRKNFKKFRRNKPGQDDAAGNDGHAARRRVQNVIVPLVEVKKNTYGFGEKYWDRPTEGEVEARSTPQVGKRRVRGQTQTRTQDLSQQSRTVNGSHPTVDEEDVANDAIDTDSHQNTPMRTSPETTILQREAAAIVDHAIDIDSPRRTRLSDQTQTQTQTQKKTATQQTSSAGTRARKRATSNAGTTTAAAKRQKTIPIQAIHGSDSDDSDDLKFRFGRRRKKA